MIKTENNQTIIRFENGDINIATGIMNIEEPLGVIAFREQEPRKIAMHNGDKPKEITEYPVIFNFTNTESIDVLIKSLELVKEDIKNRENILNSINSRTKEVNYGIMQNL